MSDTDTRMDAWAFGRRAGKASVAYRLLENADPQAVRVCAALQAKEWGVEAAFRDGLAGKDIEATDPKTGVTVAWTGPKRIESMPERIVRPGVAANGGTV